MADLWLAQSPRFTGAPRRQEDPAALRRDDARGADVHRRGAHRRRRSTTRTSSRCSTSASKTAPTSSPWSTSRAATSLAVCRRGVEVGNFMPRQLAVAILAPGGARAAAYAPRKRAPRTARPCASCMRHLPGNILVGWGGTVKLVDFGIARAPPSCCARATTPSPASTTTWLRSRSAATPVDGRADFFALGIILYELTVGSASSAAARSRPSGVLLDEPISAAHRAAPRLPGVASKRSSCARSSAIRRDATRRRAQLRTDLMAWLAETGLPHDKRRVAEYLRSDLPPQEDSATPTSSPATAATTTLGRRGAAARASAAGAAAGAPGRPRGPPDEVHLVAPAAGEVQPLLWRRRRRGSTPSGRARGGGADRRHRRHPAERRQRGLRRGDREETSRLARRGAPPRRARRRARSLARAADGAAARGSRRPSGSWCRGCTASAPGGGGFSAFSSGAGLC